MEGTRGKDLEDTGRSWGNPADRLQENRTSVLQPKGNESCQPQAPGETLHPLTKPYPRGTTRQCSRGGPDAESGQDREHGQRHEGPWRMEGTPSGPPGWQSGGWSSLFLIDDNP